MLLDRKPGSIDKILNYLKAQDGDSKSLEITEKDKEIADRMVRLQALVLRHSKVIALGLYRRVFGVSVAQSYRDYTSMEYLFGSAQKSNKDFQRELSLLKYEMYEKLCLERGDIKLALHARDKIFDWATKESEQPPYDPTKVERPLIVVGSFPDKFKNSGIKSEEDLSAFIAKLKTSTAFRNLAEDIDYKEFNDEETPDSSQ